MPPPARPPWHPEQLKRTKSCRPSPMAVRSSAYGFAVVLGDVCGPGIGPTAARAGGGAAVDPPCGGGPPHAAKTAQIAIAAPPLAIIGGGLHRNEECDACRHLAEQ